MRVSVLLRSGLGRPRFLVGRFGVEDSESEPEEGAGDVRSSRWGESDGDMVWSGASPQRDGACDVGSVVGEKQSGSFGWVCWLCVGSKGKPPVYCAICPNSAGLNDCSDIG
jgi:hypothetical protein